MRRVILVRNPLFLLTSYFTLYQLLQYKTALKKHGISIDKILYAHEPEVLATAYQVMNELFIAPSTETLSEWLSEQANHIIGFLEKWVHPAIEKPQPFLQVVRYEEIISFIVATLDEVQDYLPNDTKQRVDTFAHNSANSFSARQDPYDVPSKKISSYMSENANAFKRAVEEIRLSDKCGLWKD